VKKIFVPTCRLCEKMNDTMTHCAIFGPINPENVDSPVYTQGCVKSGDYVRLLHAVPNEHNFIDPEIAEENQELRVYTSNNKEDNSFSIRHGMTLEEWANETFSIKRGDMNESD
jgi:hypothetical protein